MNGFAYNGVHCSTFGVEYTPDAQDRWFASPDYDVTSATVKGHDGGYYYGNDAKPRLFTLRCIVEDIPKVTRERLRHWIDRNTSGKQVFDDLPFIYYNVRPTKLDMGKIYAHRRDGDIQDLYSGPFTITFTAYDPFGYMTYAAYEDTDLDHASDYCGILSQNQMPPSPTLSSRKFQLYNCGTEKADTVITIAGTAANGLKITNYTNGNVCTLTSLPPTDAIVIDSATGTVRYGGVLAFAYHNHGFIRLDSYLPDTTGVEARYTSGSNVVTITGNIPQQSWKGRYIYLNAEWRKISSVNQDGTIILSESMGTTGTETTRVVTMNEIEITGSNISLSTLTVDYTPRIL